MPTTVEALVVLVFAIAPGLLFELGIERGQPYWRTTLVDRTLRFFAWSFLLHALALPLSIWILVRLRDEDWKTFGRETWILWAAAAAYTLLPLILGMIVGGSHRLAERLRSLVFGKDLPPHAWDRLWATDRPGYVRVRFRESGLWTAGAWSYASSHPAEHEDLLLDPVIACDADSGELLLDDDGFPFDTGWAVLICRSDVERIEFQPHVRQPKEHRDDRQR